MHELEAVYTIWLREMIRYVRAKERIIGSLAMPIFWLLIFGSSIRASVGMNIDYTSFIAPGILVMALMFNSIHSGITVIWDRELGFMKEMLVAPISRLSIVAGKALGGATAALILPLCLFLPKSRRYIPKLQYQRMFSLLHYYILHQELPCIFPVCNKS